MPQSNGPPRHSSPATSPAHTDVDTCRLQEWQRAWYRVVGIASDGPSELRYPSDGPRRGLPARLWAQALTERPEPCASADERQGPVTPAYRIRRSVTPYPVTFRYRLACLAAGGPQLQLPSVISPNIFLAKYARQHPACREAYLKLGSPARPRSRSSWFPSGRHLIRWRCERG